MESDDCSERNIQSSRTHCFRTKILTHTRNEKTIVVTERHIEMHRIYPLRSVVGSAKLEVCPEGGGRAGVGYGVAIMSRDE